MEALTFSKAMELYELLGSHIPDIDETDDPLEFVSKITGNITKSGQHEDYTNAVILMSGRSWEEIKQLKSEEVLNLFIDGLLINKIATLKVFCEKLGFSYA
jgi:hypothetical protein